jgi:hypothetical protein
MDAQFLQREGHRIPAVPPQPHPAAAGRPHHQDKTFWFTDFEATAFHAAKLQHLHDPTAAIRNGDFSAENPIA